MDGARRLSVRPLLPPSARPLAGVVLACCILFTFVAGADAAHKTHGNSLDRPVDNWLIGHLGPHARALELIADLGLTIPVTVVTAALVLACLAVRRFNGALLTVISVLVSAGITQFVLKPLVHQTLSGDLTYPSGHATSVFALAAAAAVLVANPPRTTVRPSLRAAVAVVAILVGCAVSIAVIGLRYHYFTDTVGGAAVGIGVVVATTFLLDSAGMRRRMHVGGLSPRLPRDQAPTEGASQPD